MHLVPFPSGHHDLNACSSCWWLLFYFDKFFQLQNTLKWLEDQLIFDIFHTEMELFLIKEMNHRNVVINFHNVQLYNKVLCKDPKEQQHLIFFWNRLKVYWLNLVNFVINCPDITKNIITNFVDCFGNLISTVCTSNHQSSTLLK